jgi:hypothetical protein
MRRREFIAGLGGAAAAAAIGGAAAWRYVARAHRDDRVRALHLKILRLQADTAAEITANGPSHFPNTQRILSVISEPIDGLSGQSTPLA